ncbi:hypothetical protein BDN70DRAFT_824728 [Pholiota conissans]|uniref:DUF6593 domain-containing protein n=1 Tax=Pholiota conissans TaxID=109636 RepID=A0A9P5ZD25_9AGAR|nr:hypothetical protein BDN70DRAFT_824728 [Pholiota conissans]
MDLFLSSTNPENTLFFSANGVVHYQVVTTRSHTPGASVSNILRPAAKPEDGVVAEIEWKNRHTPTIIRSPLLSGVGQCVGSTGIGIKAFQYLYKRNRFSPSRYFVADDALEYRWKIIKGVGCKLILCDADAEIASSSWSTVTDGVFAGETKQVLRIHPCSIDIDLIMLTFVIMENKRREKYGHSDALQDICQDLRAKGFGEEGEVEAEEGMIGEL